jgi:hypothetical protein
MLCIFVGGAVPSLAQQKGQWVPGQFGLNAGVIPEPGLTYQNLALNYSAGVLNDSNGNALPRLGGTYQFWVDENIFMYVPRYKILGVVGENMDIKTSRPTPNIDSKAISAAQYSNCRGPRDQTNA